jgi:hypothetical protein
LRLAFLAIAGASIGAMLGCGGNPGKPPIEAAKNVYVIQNNNANNVENDSLLVFAAAASGSAMPTGTLQLPSNVVALATAVGPDGKIYVGAATSENAGEVLIYAAGATGTATPQATLLGGEGSFNVPFYLAVSSKGQLYVASEDNSIASFAAGATGAATPAQYLTNYVTSGDYLSGLGVDAAGEIFAMDEKAEVIDVFAAGATGASAPARSIQASSAGSFGDLYGMAVDDAGDVTVMNYNHLDDPFEWEGGRPVNMALSAAWRQRFVHRSETVRPMSPPAALPTALLTFAAGASGTATPTRMLSGSSTQINEPEGVALDGLLNVYYEDYEGGALTVMMFPPSASGNVAATTSMTSTAFTETYFGTIAAY